MPKPQGLAIRAGELRHRMQIQSVTTTANEFNEQVQTWFTDDTVWASLEPLSAREVFTAQQVSADATHRIRMRYRSGLTHEHRIKFGERLFNIESVLNVMERNKVLDLIVKEQL